MKNVVKLLAEDTETGFVLNFVIAPPGLAAERHKHKEFEWVYVLEGELKDEHGSYPKGTLKINKKGSIHSSYTEIGCTLLIFTKPNNLIPVDK